MPFTVTGGIESKTGTLLDEQFLTELAQLAPADVTLLGASDVVTMLGQAQQRQLAGCDDASCLVEIGQALGARHLIVTSLGKLGDKFLVTAKLVDVENARVPVRKSLAVDGKESELLKAVGALASSLAAAQGWSGPVEAANPVAGAGTAEDSSSSRFLVAGVVTASGGVLATAGFGAAAFFFDGQAGQADANWDRKQQSAWLSAAMLGGLAVGVAALVAGSVMAVLGLQSQTAHPVDR